LDDATTSTSTSTTERVNVVVSSGGATAAATVPGQLQGRRATADGDGDGDAVPLQRFASQGYVRIPANVKAVRVRAKDPVAGFGGDAVEIQVPL
jgi:hypothetical protein